MCARNNGNDTFVVENFYVASFLRNLGIGGVLLDNLRIELKKLNYKKLFFKLVAKEENYKRLSSFLSKRGFLQPKILCKVYRKTTESILKTSKFTEYILKCATEKLPNNLKIIREKDITNDLKKIIIKEEGFDYPKELSPFANEYNLKDINSMFLMDLSTEKMIAWLTALDAPGNSVLYRSFFVDDKYKKYNIGKLLLKKAVEKHTKDFFNKNLMFAVSVENKKVDAALKKYFGMKAENTSYEFICEEK